VDREADEEGSMFERLNTPQEAYNSKLGAALEMENTVLEILEDSIDSAQDEKVKHFLRHHHDETKQHVTNLEQVFAAFGWDVAGLVGAARSRPVGGGPARHDAFGRPAAASAVLAPLTAGLLVGRLRPHG
jgi:Domain of unknown function (DUF892)